MTCKFISPAQATSLTFKPPYSMPSSWHFLRSSSKVHWSCFPSVLLHFTQILTVLQHSFFSYRWHRHPTVAQARTRELSLMLIFSPLLHLVNHQVLFIVPPNIPQTNSHLCIHLCHHLWPNCCIFHKFLLECYNFFYYICICFLNPFFMLWTEFVYMNTVPVSCLKSISTLVRVTKSLV